MPSSPMALSFCGSAALFQLVDGGQVLAIGLLRGVQGYGHPHGDHCHWVLGRGRPDCLFPGILHAPGGQWHLGLGLSRASALPQGCQCVFVVILQTMMQRLLNPLGCRRTLYRAQASTNTSSDVA